MSIVNRIRGTLHIGQQRSPPQKEDASRSRDANNPQPWERSREEKKQNQTDQQGDGFSRRYPGGDIYRKDRKPEKV